MTAPSASARVGDWQCDWPSSTANMTQSERKMEVSTGGTSEKQDGSLTAADEGFNYQRAVDDWMRSGHTSSRRSVLRRVEVLGGRTVLLAAPQREAAK